MARSSRKLLFLVVAAALGVLVVFSALVIFLIALVGAGSPGLAALGEGDLVSLGGTLPDSAIVINCGDYDQVVAPFARSKDPAGATGVVAVLPAGSDTDDNRGMLSTNVTIAKPGKYQLWARAKWDDTCSNSVSCQVGDCKPRILGQDSVFNAWHWVKLPGDYQLKQGTVKVVLREREDGIAIDQCLLVPAGQFQPSGPIRDGLMLPDARRYADNFYRSPGHGMGDWNVVSGNWDIAFSLDPNRVPFQYGMKASPKDGEPAVCEFKSAPLPGLKAEVSFLATKDSVFGVTLLSTDRMERIPLRFNVTGDNVSFTWPGGKSDLAAAVRLGQWHRLCIESWAGVLEVSVDGKVVCQSFDSLLAPMRVSLNVDSGEVVYDDFALTEVLFSLDAPVAATIPWRPAKGAVWGRPTTSNDGTVLVGRKGVLTTAQLPGVIDEVLIVNGQGEPPGFDGITITAMSRKGDWVLCKPLDGRKERRLTLKAAPGGDVKLKLVAIRYAASANDIFRFGTSDFNERYTEDVSDYLDFTDEEYQEIKDSPDVEKLRRKPRRRAVLGRRLQGIWQQQGRRDWRLDNGTLYGLTRNRPVLFHQELNGDLQMQLKLKLEGQGSAVAIGLYGGMESEQQVVVSAPDASLKPGENSLELKCPKLGEWANITIKTDARGLAAKVDDQPWQRLDATRGLGGRISLTILAGKARFDDIAITLPRHGQNSHYYGFDQRETDWWREGGKWVDHAGIACALASNWINLNAPKSKGMLINKRSFEGDFLFAFNVEEATEWFGWDQKHSHVHYPWDNIVVKLLDKDGKDAYEFRINAENRTKTKLMRNGKVVAEVTQDSNFPFRYRGGHSPISPRISRMLVTRQGDTLSLIINDKKVLTYSAPDVAKTSQIALGGFSTHINFSNVEIVEMSSGEGRVKKMFIPGSV